MRLGDVKRVARANGSPGTVAAVDFLLRQLRRPKRAQFHKQAVEFELRLAQDPTKCSPDSESKDMLTNGGALTMLSRFTNLWIDFCFDNNIDDSQLSSYK